MVVKKQGGKGRSTAMKVPFLSPWLTSLKRKGGLTDAKLRIRIERSNTFAFLLKG